MTCIKAASCCKINGISGTCSKTLSVSVPPPHHLPPRRSGHRHGAKEIVSMKLLVSSSLVDQPKCSGRLRPLRSSGSVPKTLWSPHFYYLRALHQPPSPPSPSPIVPGIGHRTGLPPSLCVISIRPEDRQHLQGPSAVARLRPLAHGAMRCVMTSLFVAGFRVVRGRANGKLMWPWFV